MTNIHIILNEWFVHENGDFRWMMTETTGGLCLHMEGLNDGPWTAERVEGFQALDYAQIHTNEELMYSATQFYSRLYRVEIGAGCIGIGRFAFEDCENLVEITLPDTVTFIDNNAFRSCSSLSSIQLPDSITRIGSEAFYCCTRLTQVHLPDSITTIDSHAFEYCSQLKKINLPAGLTTFSYGVFEGCHPYLTVDIPDALRAVGYSMEEDHWGRPYLCTP